MRNSMICKSLYQNGRQIASTVLVAALTLVVFGYGNSFAQTWSAPTGTAPGGNTPAPLNLGSALQEKLGPLAINTSTVSPASVGLNVFGKSNFHGQILGKDDVCIEVDGDIRCLSDALEEDEPVVVVPPTSSCTQLYTSLGTGTQVDLRPGWTSVAVPAACKTVTGCLLKQEAVHNNSNNNKTLIYRHFQNTSTGVWSNDWRPTKSFTNGDSTVTHVFPMRHDGHLVIVDDRPSIANNINGVKQTLNYAETSKDNISIRDTSGVWGTKLSVCQ